MKVKRQMFYFNNTHLAVNNEADSGQLKEINSIFLWMKHSVLLAEVSQACDECPSERPTNDR